MSKILPKLVVFDLDYTLWPFWVDTHVTPPFSKVNEKVFDIHGQNIKHYSEVPEVLEKLISLNIDIGVASRTSEIDGAEQLLDLFDWNKYIKYKQIYPGSKVAHFNKIHKLSKIAFEDMIFFDDESRNIRDVSKLNVTCILVNERVGVNLNVLQTGFDQFAKKKNGMVKDTSGNMALLYPDVVELLQFLKAKDIPMAVASRITDIPSAYHLMHLLNIYKFFQFAEIYPTRKTLHFERLLQKTGFNYDKMFFYDDDRRNIRDVSILGVITFLVEGGLSFKSCSDLIKMFSN